MSIQMSGTYSYQITNGTIRVDIGQVSNTSSNYTSGTIKFELWLSSTQYYGGSLFGYEIAEIRLDEFPQGGDGRLSPGETFSNITFYDPFDENVPDGRYYFVLVVTEYQSSNSGFAIVDYGTFSNSELVGDFPTSPPPDDTIYGTAAGETLTGTFENDVIFGYGGNDNLWGFQGMDRLYGGRGNDKLAGHSGADKLYGGRGVDIADYIIAGKNLVVDLASPGRNTGHARGDKYWSIEGVLGSNYADRLFGNGENNKIMGWKGSDRISGRKGNDELEGMNGRDFISGDGGRDKLLGGAHADKLFGGVGRDNLFGGSGNDRLVGGNDRDVMTGGSGADQFVFSARSHVGKGTDSDYIRDFGRGNDRINLSGIDANTQRAGNQDFKFIGGREFSDRAGELRYKDGYAYADVNGDGRVNFRIEVDIVDGNRLFGSDFIL